MDAAEQRNLDGGIVIMSANVAAGFPRDEEIEAAIRAERPHIVAFQELDRAQGERLRDRLRDVLPYDDEIADGNEGRGILSAFPFKAVEMLEIADGRPDLVALIDVEGKELYVVIGHPRPQTFGLDGLSFSFDSKKQILELGRIANHQTAAVLVGDMNMTPRNRAYTRLTEMGLVDAFAERGEGSGRTFIRRPKFLSPLSTRLAGIPLPPLVRFDYIWCTTPIGIERAWVGTDTGSDHLPILAELHLPG